MSGKKTKLKKIEFTSVDMVRRGANQEAYINLYKSAGDPAEPDDTPNNTPEAPNSDETSQGILKSIMELLKGLIGHGEAENSTPEDSDPEEVGEEVEKAAETFQTRVSQQEIRDSRWKYQDALNMSIESILIDNDLSDEEKVEMMNQSVEQFSACYKDMCAKLVKTTANKPKAEPTEDVGKSQDGSLDYNEEGDKEMMKIDKSRFTAEELAQYEALIAKGMVEEDPTPAATEPTPAPAVEKSAELHPEVQKALNEMAELKKSMEMKELSDVAKKYAPLGKKENELTETLYEMRKSSPAAYDEYIAVLNQNLELVNKSGMFEEIGKSSRTTAGGSTVEKIEGIATELQKSDATLGRHEAIMKAWEQHPELVAEYDKEYMGGN